MPRAAFFLASGAAVTCLVSIAAYQTLLAAALLLLLLSRQRLEFPPILLPLGIFVALTLISLALSSDPRAGLPQVVKFYVFLMLPVIYTAIRHASDIRKLVWWWAAAASASGIWSFVQFWTKRQRALEQHGDFYAAYVGDRVTGFVGHWMTFGAAQMAALLLLLAVLIFAGPKRYRGLAIGAALLITASIVIGWTRSVWLGTAVSSIYLVAVWRPRFLLLAPLLLLVGWFVSPRSVRQRVISIYQPNERQDSNRHRYVTFRTGVQMIKAHPVFGIGPEMPGTIVRAVRAVRYTTPSSPGILRTSSQCLSPICGRTRTACALSFFVDDHEDSLGLVEARSLDHGPAETSDPARLSGSAAGAAYRRLL